MINDILNTCKKGKHIIKACKTDFENVIHKLFHNEYLLSFANKKQKKVIHLLFEFLNTNLDFFKFNNLFNPLLMLEKLFKKKMCKM